MIPQKSTQLSKYTIESSEETVNTILNAAKGFSKLSLNLQLDLEESVSVHGMANHEYRSRKIILYRDIEITSVGEQ